MSLSETQTQMIQLRTIAPILSIFVMAGCTTTHTGGVWHGLEAKRNDQSFYQGHYVGTQVDCFPPISKRQCVPIKKAETLYEPERKLEMESFNFSMSSDFFGQAQVKDRLYFAASELALRRGFKMFTVTTTFDVTTCRNGIDATTTGTLTANPAGQGSSYSGSTSIRPRGECVINQGIRVIYFKYEEDLAQGVLARATTGTAQWLYPETSLYYGTIPNLRYEDFNYQSLPGAFTRTPENAWKVHYDAEGLSADFRKKYRLENPPPIAFRDEAQENTRREADDPLQKRRVVSP